MSTENSNDNITTTDDVSSTAMERRKEDRKEEKEEKGEQDLTLLSPNELILRITTLESRLKKTTEELEKLTANVATTDTTTTTTVQNNHTRFKRRAATTGKPFDISLYHTRHVAFKFSYVGGSYSGYEHSNNTTSAPSKPAVEEVLWKALRKARLVSPTVSEGADASYDVVWDERERAERYGVTNRGVGTERLELNWEGMEYSKCGRTDKGVSAFGQVIGVRVRSSRPKRRLRTKEKNTEEKQELHGGEKEAVLVVDQLLDHESDDTDQHPTAAEDKEEGEDIDWDPVRDELNYIALLNNVLPPTIRILAWCPHPPSGFDARFSCDHRRYKYFFTNPAFCPTPGRLGLHDSKAPREGWLDVDAMKKAAKKLEGLHDYRNFCKIDPSKQMPSCERRIFHADVEEFKPGLQAFEDDARLNSTGVGASTVINGCLGQGAVIGAGPRVFSFNVHGTAFLWHQVRCMVAILFLVGQGLEKPELVDELLDIERTPGKPAYDMADDAPLVLWDCVFPGDNGDTENGLKWVYAGDEGTIKQLTAKGDGKFGMSGVVDHLWTQWREAKMQEILTSSLLGLALYQGDGSALERGGQRSVENARTHSQKVYEGSVITRLVGTYTPVMQRSKMASLEALNEKYRLSARGAKREIKKTAAMENGGGD